MPHLLPQCIACCLNAYFDKKRSLQRVIHFQVSYSLEKIWLQTPFPNSRTEKRKIQAQNDSAATNPTQNSAKFQFSTYSILPVEPTPSRSLLPKFPVYTFLTTRVHIHDDTRLFKPAGLIPTIGVDSYLPRAVVNILMQTISFSPSQSLGHL